MAARILTEEETKIYKHQSTSISSSIETPENYLKPTEKKSFAEMSGDERNAAAVKNHESKVNDAKSKATPDKDSKGRDDTPIIK